MTDFQSPRFPCSSPAGFKRPLAIGPRWACVSFSVPLAIFFRTITIVRRIYEPPGPREWVGVGNEDDGRHWQTPDPEGLPGRRVISDPRIPTRPSPARLGLFNTSRYEARRPLGRGRGHADEPPPDHSHATFLIFTFTLATAGDGRPRRAAPHRALRPIFLGERVRENRPSEGGLGTESLG